MMWSEDADYAFALQLQEEDRVADTSYNIQPVSEENNDSNQSTSTFGNTERYIDVRPMSDLFEMRDAAANNNNHHCDNGQAKPQWTQGLGAAAAKEASTPSLTLQSRSTHDLSWLVDPSVILPGCNDPDDYIEISDGEHESFFASARKPGSSKSKHSKMSSWGGNNWPSYRKDVIELSDTEDNASFASARKPKSSKPKNSWNGSSSSETWAPNPLQECPICLKIVGARNMNDHLDACIEFRSG